MLVLSRRLNEKIVFPGFGATIQVVGIKGNNVRLGIQAPPEIIVLREEVPDRQAEWGQTVQGPAGVAGREQSELVRLVDKRLAIAGKGLDLLQRQLLAGLSEEALAGVGRLADDLQMLRQRLATEVRKSAAPPPGRKPRKALLVEDNANERELLAQFLRLGGFEVDTAGDGADALDYLRGRGRPDVVLLDMGMPRCDGPTMVREIRRDGGLASLKIVAVSGHSPDEYNLERGPRGIDRWFCKPVDPAALLTDLERELDCSLSS